MTKDQRIIFWGSPEFAADILHKLLKEKFNIVAVVTQPDKKIGRKQEISEPPVKSIALKNKINIFQPENLKEEEFIRQIKRLEPDLLLVAAYGKIIPKDILDIPRRGSINVHASLLPKYRGASPIQSAIIAGDEKTGVTLMLMDSGLDTGDIIAQKEIKIGKDETSETLTKKLSALGGELLVNSIGSWLEGGIKAIPQDSGQASYSKIIKRQDGEINWEEPALEIYQKYKAYFPWPGLHTLLDVKGELKRIKLVDIYPLKSPGAGGKAGKIIKVEEKIAVQTSEGLLAIRKAQIEGKREMAAEEIAKGYPELIGSVFQNNFK
ncbi:MAG: methionyl-tRNA formyltransferase [Parcubacteria group bacterium]|jgi:methionyl-tRNA formyltransferase